MLWDYMKTLIMLRLTLEPPCICAAVSAAGAQVSPFGRIVLALRPPKQWAPLAGLQRSKTKTHRAGTR
jgi:hypothetical protein